VRPSSVRLVTVMRDATLTPTELEAVERVIHTVGPCTDSDTLSGLLERLLYGELYVSDVKQ